MGIGAGSCSGIAAMDKLEEGYLERFSGIARVYGEQQLLALSQAHFAVAGIGGVGSWAAEALARSGVGNITLIDPDKISLSNVNRQIHALSSTVDEIKTEVMAQRIKEINPQCKVTCISDWLNEDTARNYLGGHLDGLIDATDSVKQKSALLYFCKRNKLLVIATGGAGGLIDPLKITTADVSRTHNDPLIAKVRSTLRSQYGFTRNPARRFGIECVYSSEQPRFPAVDGSITMQKPGVKGLSLDCYSGYGAAPVVTSVFGMIAVSRLFDRYLKKPQSS